MKSGHRSQTSSQPGTGQRGRKHAVRASGELSRTESALDAGAGWIDHVIDGLRDRPMVALAFAAGSLFLAAIISVP